MAGNAPLPKANGCGRITRAAGFQPAACPPPGMRASPTSSRQGPGQTRNPGKHPKPCGLEIRDTADWKSAVQGVPQVSNLLCRRLPVGRALDKLATPENPPNLTDWKSATQQTGSLRYRACRRFPTCCLPAARQAGIADFQSAGPWINSQPRKNPQTLRIGNPRHGRLEVCGTGRAAGFQPAVSPTSSRQRADISDATELTPALRIGNPRHGRLEVCGTKRAAGFQPAVSPTSSRQRADISDATELTPALRIGNPRHGRLEVCGTGRAAGFQPAACPPPGRRVSPTSSRQGPG